MGKRQSTRRYGDRRAVSRPVPRQMRRCPDCGGVMLFYAEPLLLREGRPEPGWVCGDPQCNAREFVRRPQRPKKT